jgi:bifunctional DNA-binding transcriptional regulator/antitoxin component of YhaV-PrlF toxin-antitoxin module
MLMKISRSGSIYFPQELLDKYNLRAGDGICFESLGNDTFSIKKV